MNMDLQIERLRVNTFLPLIPWKIQKIAGPAFNRDVGKAIALHYVPPPQNVVISIAKEFAKINTPALLSPSYRRRLRNLSQSNFRRQFRDNSGLLAIRQLLLRWRQDFQAKGCTVDPSVIRKLRDIEAETNEDYRKLFSGEQPPEKLKQIIREHPDALNLLWEFSLYGEGGTKPELRRNSELWGILGIDTATFLDMPLEKGVIHLLSRFLALLGLDGQPPDEPNLHRLLEWVIKTHLPSEREPETTPEAVSKAVLEGLIHKPTVVKDKETGEKVSDAIDPTSTRFVRELEDEDEASSELDRLASQVKLTKSELIIFAGLRQGLEDGLLEKYVQANHISKLSMPVIKFRLMKKLRQVKP